MQRVASTSTVQGVADLEVLQRMGLHPQRQARRQGDEIFADIAEEDVIADRRPGAWFGSGAEPDAFRPDRDFDGVTRREPVERIDLHRKLGRDLDGAAGAAALAHLAGHEVHQAHEIRDHAVGGTGIDLERRPVLLHASEIHDRDLVRQRQRLGLVVGDVDESDPGAALQFLELGAHALAQLGVEIGQRLVEQQDVGLDHQRAGERNALLLAAGQLARIAGFEPREIHQRQRLLDLAARLGGRDFPDLEAEHDVLEHVLVRPDRVVLEHHAHAARFRRHHRTGRRQEPAVDLDGAAVGRHVAGDQPQRRGLAAAGRAEQRDEGIVLDLDIDVGHRRDVAIARRERFRQSANGDPSHTL